MTKDFIIGLMFFNPLFMAIYNTAIFFWYGLPGVFAISIIFALPTIYYYVFTTRRPGIAKYLLMTQAFFTFTILGGLVIYTGLSGSTDMMMVLFGVLLLIPALTIAMTAILFG